MVVLACAGMDAVSRAEDGPSRIQTVSGTGQGSWGIERLANGRMRFYQRSLNLTDQTLVWIPVFEARADAFQPAPPAPAPFNTPERAVIDQYRANPTGRFTLEEHATIERYRQAMRAEQATRTGNVNVRVAR
jgi:hypothetical protein